MIFTHHPCVSLARFSFCWWRQKSIADDVTMTRQFDAITWIVISNLLNIDFIHGNIHDRSCKKHVCCEDSGIFLKNAYIFDFYILNLIM